VLDLGAGTGLFAAAIASWFDAEVVAVEPSAGMRRSSFPGRHQGITLFRFLTGAGRIAAGFPTTKLSSGGRACR
jgi:hypothetical protein